MSNHPASSVLAGLPAGRPRLDLRAVLAFDAFTCIAMGLALILFSAPAATLLGLDGTFVFWAGTLLLPSAALMVLAAITRSRVLNLVVVAGNVLWAIASCVVAFELASAATGMVLVLLQAAAVAVLAALEFVLSPTREAA